MLGKVLIFFVKIYQNTVGLVLPNSCRFTPTCSVYMVDSIIKHGSLKGTWNGLKRISRCHPYSKSSGWDPVE
jgi:uncharacterized protein